MPEAASAASLTPSAEEAMEVQTVRGTLLVLQVLPALVEM